MYACRLSYYLLCISPVERLVPVEIKILIKESNKIVCLTAVCSPLIFSVLYPFCARPRARI
jgi:hypothetical protein